MLYSDFNKIELELKNNGLTKENISYPSLEEINNLSDSHILIEDAEMCILRAHKTLKHVTEYPKKSLNI